LESVLRGDLFALFVLVVFAGAFLASALLFTGVSFAFVFAGGFLAGALLFTSVAFAFVFAGAFLAGALLFTGVSFAFVFAGAFLAGALLFTGVSFAFFAGSLLVAIALRVGGAASFTAVFSIAFGPSEDAYANASPNSARSLSRSSTISVGTTTNSFIASPGTGSKSLAPSATRASRRASGRCTMIPS